MADPKPIVVNNFQKGIAESPYLGFADMRNLNVLTSPGAASVNFATSALTKPPTVSALAYTVATTDIFTVSSTSGWFNGMAVTLNTVVTATGISTGRVYWVGDLTATTFKLYKGPSLNAATLADVTLGGSGTISSYTMSAPLDGAVYYGGQSTDPFELILDSNGLVWWINGSNLTYLGNDTTTGTTGRAIAVFANNIVVFRTSAFDTLNVGRVVDDIDLDSASGWDYAVDTLDSVFQNPRPVQAAQDNILYYAGDERVGKIDSAMTRTHDALDLEDGEIIYALGELGTKLLVAGRKNYIYPWDRVGPSFDIPIILPENTVSRIVSANQSAFIFAGTKGRIYVTNGVSVALYKKIPDHLTGVPNPHFTWNDALLSQNQLYFSFNALENDGDALATLSGVWAIDLDYGTLRLSNQLSYAAYTGSASVLLPNILSSTPPGDGIYIGWSNSSTYGVDVSSSNFYTSYASYFVSEMFLAGTAWHPRRFNKLYLELNRPLVTGQGIKVSFRTSLADSFTEIDTFDHTDYPSMKTLEKTYQIQTEKIQFKVELTTAASTQPPELLAVTII